eukprot:1634467-Pyramimonas_sp.AAC.1
MHRRRRQCIGDVGVSSTSSRIADASAMRRDPPTTSAPKPHGHMGGLDPDDARSGHAARSNSAAAAPLSPCTPRALPPGVARARGFARLGRRAGKREMDVDSS